MILTGLSTWLMLVFQPDGSIGLYTLGHVALAVFAAVVAALSLTRVDPLRLRSDRSRQHRAVPNAPKTPATEPTGDESTS